MSSQLTVVTVDTRIGLVGEITAVRTLGVVLSMGSTRGGARSRIIVVVTSDGLLHFVEKSRHD